MTTTLDGSAAPAPPGRTYDVGASDEIAERGRLVVSVDAPTGPVTLGVFRFGGRLYAYENVCAHQGGPACQGRIVSRVRERLDDQQRSLGTAFDDATMHIVCPWHGFEYDVTTGRHPGRPDFALCAVAVSEENGRVRVTV
jgi:nitrite reductase/ring-hydroxylating ferredoxin subunit